MLQVAIVEDDAKDSDRLAEFFKRYERERKQQVRCSFFTDGIFFISDYTSSYDIILMDIAMPNMDGVTYTCYTLENEYQNLDAINSIELGDVVTNDGPAGFAYDQVPGYAYNWQVYESDEPTYVGADDENADTSVSVYNTEPVVAST